VLPLLPLLQRVPERRTHDYLRHGTTNLYAALDVASGRVIADTSPRHRADEFRRFLGLIDESVPAHSTCASCSTTPRAARPCRYSAGSSATRSFTLHHLQLLAQPGRALVLRAHDEVARALSPPLAPRPRRLDPHLITD
jgi:hypothetical protein